MSLKIKIHFISRINFPHNILPSLVLSNALALKLRHGHGHAGHGGPLFFLSGHAPKARPARCPMLTYMAGYRPVKVYLVLSQGCNGEHQVATASAKLRPRARRCDRNGSGCQGEAAVHIVFHTLPNLVGLGVIVIWRIC